MRRESSTIVALVGRVSGAQLAALTESPNVSVVRLPASAPAPASASEQPGTRTSLATSGTGESLPAALPGWEHGARAMREAAQRRSTYVVVADDPLAGVAAAWRAMWEVGSGPEAVAMFEERAGDTLTAWRQNKFELPDYYLVVAPAQDSTTGPDLYLGPLRAARPRRVAVAVGADHDNPAGISPTASLLDTLRSLGQGPWWPPLDELVDAARKFYAGGLAESQQAPV